MCGLRSVDYGRAYKKVASVSYSARIPAPACGERAGQDSQSSINSAICKGRDIPEGSSSVLCLLKDSGMGASGKSAQKAFMFIP